MMKMGILFQAVIKNPILAIAVLISPVVMTVRIYFLYHPKINKGGIFGYEYWSVFLDSIMWPLFAFAVGLIFQIIKINYIEDVKGRVVTNLASLKAYCISFFYLAISAFPYRQSYAYRLELNHAWYYIIVAVLGIVAALILIKAPESVFKQLKSARFQVKVMQNSLSVWLEMIMKWKYRVDDTREYSEEIYKNSKDTGLIK